MAEERDETDIYDAAGGSDAPFFALVDAFYDGVQADPALRALYPDDLAPGKRHLAWFLIQRFGGPERFNQQRGAPRLRMRHNPFPITPAQAQRWLAHMTAALDTIAVFAPHKAAMRAYFAQTALFLVNREPESDGRRAIAHIPVRNA